MFDKDLAILSCDLKVLPEDLDFTEEVGAGAYGEVWKGRWNGKKGGGADVAIKKVVLRGATEEHQRKALAEVGIPFISSSSSFVFTVMFFFDLPFVYILTRLKHPNIMPIYGACIIEKKELWIVMQFIEGGSLFELLHSEQEIPWAWRLR